VAVAVVAEAVVAAAALAPAVEVVPAGEAVRSTLPTSRLMT
jgi:hypothetical protein